MSAKSFNFYAPCDFAKQIIILLMVAIKMKYVEFRELLCDLGGGYFGLMRALHADLVLADFKDFGIIGEVRCPGLMGILENVLLISDISK